MKLVFEKEVSTMLMRRPRANSDAY